MLLDLLPDHTTDTRPTRPTNENHVGRHEPLATLTPSDTSDTSDTKTGECIPPRERGVGLTLFTQVDPETPESVRHDENGLRQKGLKKTVSDVSYGETTFQDPTPEQIAHANRMLVDCPNTPGVKWHCWYCSRCSKSSECSAWHHLRSDVKFFKLSGPPYSLAVVEQQKTKPKALAPPPKEYAPLDEDIEHRCTFCGQVFERPEGLSSESWQNKRYCSAACFNGKHSPLGSGDIHGVVQ